LNSNIPAFVWKPQEPFSSAPQNIDQSWVLHHKIILKVSEEYRDMTKSLNSQKKSKFLYGSLWVAIYTVKICVSIHVYLRVDLTRMRVARKTTTQIKKKSKHVAGACRSKVYVFYDEFKVIF
jgi:hypothetical protein